MQDAFTEFGDPWADYLKKLSGVESGGDLAARNPRSSASGWFQFTDATKRDAAAAGVPYGNDPESQTRAAAWLTGRNAELYRKQFGRDPSYTDLYGMHYFGPGGYFRVASNPSAPLSSVLPAHVMAANPNLAGMTWEGFAAKYGPRFGAASSSPPQQPQGTTAMASHLFPQDWSNPPASPSSVFPEHVAAANAARPNIAGVTQKTPAMASHLFPQDPSGRWIPEDNITQSRRAAHNFWETPRGGYGSGWGGGLAAALSGLGYGLFSQDANNAALANQDLRNRTMANAVNAPDNVSMAKMLMSGGVPDLGEMGLKTIVSDRNREAERKADLEKQKQLMTMHGDADIAKARSMLPLEIEKAKAIGKANDEIAAAKEARLRRERAVAAQTVGMDRKSREFMQYVLTGSVGKDPTRQLSVSDIGKLSDEGGKLQNALTFSSTFQDPFAGYTIGGETAMAARRLNIPGAGMFASKEAAEWWQQYDRYKNQIRNDLFGSALTRTEQAAFEKADIRPNMDPSIIRKNLAEQEKIIRQGVTRKAMALVAAGYDPDVVASSYGVDLSRDLGVSRNKAENKPGGGIPEKRVPLPDSPQAPAPARRTPDVGAIEDGYRFKGGDPSKAESWEVVR